MGAVPSLKPKLLCGGWERGTAGNRRHGPRAGGPGEVKKSHSKNCWEFGAFHGDGRR